MVRKISVYLCVLVLIFACCATAQAASHEVYENGSLSSTYTTYFKDILAGVSVFDNYVAFRSGQYDYTMITGNIEYNESTKTFTLDGTGQEYVFTSGNTGYNSTTDYYVSDITDFSLQVNNNIIYSDLGNFPELMDRGSKYEILTTILVIILLLSFVVRAFFQHS